MLRSIKIGKLSIHYQRGVFFWISRPLGCRVQPNESFAGTEEKQAKVERFASFLFGFPLNSGNLAGHFPVSISATAARTGNRSLSV